MIETLSYWYNNHPNVALTGTGQKINYVVKGNNHYYEVLAPTVWRLHLVTDRWIRLLLDTGNNAVGARMYTMFPGYWLPRQCEVGWSRHFQSNQVEWYDADCQPYGKHRAPYTMALLSQGIVDCGGDLGKLDCITVGYHVHDEVFTYAKGWGLVKWTKPGYPDSVFNVIDHHPTVPIAVCGRS